MGEPQRDIPAATTRWAPSSRGRLGFSARDRQLYFFPETSECNGRKNGREGEGERATRTWTLDALRAATEPVKVEAMQAIVEVGCFEGSVRCAGVWRELCVSAVICANSEDFFQSICRPPDRSSVVGPEPARAASV